LQAEQAAGNPLARMIVGLKLDENRFTMALADPYADATAGEDDDDDEEEEDGDAGERKEKGGGTAPQVGRRAPVCSPSINLVHAISEEDDERVHVRGALLLSRGSSFDFFFMPKMSD
jgi:hypothetical protein